MKGQTSKWQEKKKEGARKRAQQTQKTHRSALCAPPRTPPKTPKIPFGTIREIGEPHTRNRNYRLCFDGEYRLMHVSPPPRNWYFTLIGKEINEYMEKQRGNFCFTFYREDDEIFNEFVRRLKPAADFFPIGTAVRGMIFLIATWRRHDKVMHKGMPHYDPLDLTGPTDADVCSGIAQIEVFSLHKCSLGIRSNS